ncbi:uncharacterized protein [Anabrus simplex]|uniref:uncharacterized protein n=1 Tax=Anabrus simplex TaxID=316456 RepID=UPI0035A3CAB3
MHPASRLLAKEEDQVQELKGTDRDLKDRTSFRRMLKQTIRKENRVYRSQRTMYNRGQDNVEFDFLVDDVKSSISFLLSLRQKKVTQEVVLELTDDSWSRPESSTRLPKTSQNGEREVDTYLEPLDARSLLTARTAAGRERSVASSTPPSSLELEWEHEDFVPRSVPPPIATLPEEDDESTAGWSRLSTPDSLEWDPVEAPLASDSGGDNRGELDAETEQLLCEIERLTSRALRETGDWSS